MKAIRLDEPRKLAMIEAEPPRVLCADEALVRVHRIGVCGTDLHAFNGRQPFFSYPRILGHELGVEVLEIGDDVANVRPGDLCAVEPYLNCGSCVACRRDKPNCCAKLEVLGVHADGGMRERFALPARKLHCSDRLTPDQLALVETLGIGAHAVERAQIERGEFVLVIGAGPIGLSVMQFAIEAGAQLIVLDVNQERLNFCREQLHVPHAINLARQDALTSLRQITADELPTVVFDATGNANSMMTAFDYCAPGGTLVFVGLCQGEITFDDPDFHRRELTLLATRNAAPPDFSRIIQLIEAGRINIAPWITHRAQFEDVVRGFPVWARPENGVIKAMIEV